MIEDNECFQITPANGEIFWGINDGTIYPLYCDDDYYYVATPAPPTCELYTFDD